MYQNFAILALLILIYSLVAGKIERGPITAPIVFLITGLILGPFVFHLLEVNFVEERYKVLAEFALALVLFTDASKTNLQVLKNNLDIPLHLLLVGLPISIVAGTLFGKLVFPGFAWIELAILSVVLAPTDAALGEPVVSNKRVPSKIREGINVESGLNDGICVPVLLLLLALHSVHRDEQVTFGFGLGIFARQIGIGLAVGLAIAFVGDLLIKNGIGKKWIEPAWKSSILVLMALACFTLAQSLGGSGFIATFSGGLLFGGRHKLNKAELVHSAEGTGKVLTSVVWIVFGSVVTGRMLPQLTWEIVLYSVASLTVIRILPVLLCLIFSRLSNYGKFFIAWFGPRGLASIVFAVLVFEEHLHNGQTIVVTACFTILLSVFAHGFSAGPMAGLFRAEEAGD